MGAAIVWTNEDDARLIELRAKGLTWSQLAKHFPFARETICNHGRALRAEGKMGPFVAPRARRAGRPEGPVEPKTLNPKVIRGAWPVGHPMTWGLIIKGTILEGASVHDVL